MNKIIFRTAVTFLVVIIGFNLIARFYVYEEPSYWKTYIFDYDQNYNLISFKYVKPEGDIYFSSSNYFNPDMGRINIYENLQIEIEIDKEFPCKWFYPSFIKVLFRIDDEEVFYQDFLIENKSGTFARRRNQGDKFEQSLVYVDGQHFHGNMLLHGNEDYIKQFSKKYEAKVNLNLAPDGDFFSKASDKRIITQLDVNKFIDKLMESKKLLIRVEACSRVTDLSINLTGFKEEVEKYKLYLSE